MGSPSSYLRWRSSLASDSWMARESWKRKDMRRVDGKVERRVYIDDTCVDSSDEMEFGIF